MKRNLLDREVVRSFETPREIAHVPLGGKHGAGKFATLYWSDWLALQKLGLSPYWSLTANNIQSRDRSGRNRAVARVILDLGPKEKVLYKDGDGTNLRRSNLVATKGYALREAVPTLIEHPALEDA